MPRAPKYQRGPADIRPGRIGQWPTSGPTAEEIAERCRYVANGEHKTYPSKDGSWTLMAKADKAKCAVIHESQWPLVVAALKQAIREGCISDQFENGFPRRVWAHVNGTLHEARLSNSLRGEYHAFPLEYESQYPIDEFERLRNAPRVTID